ncbi:MAG: hypothetical protein ABIS27_09090 [Longimicrobiales bacterium]
MINLRPARTFAALFALVSLLFMQMALAWYECPADRIGGAAQLLAASERVGGAVAHGCEGTDPEQPGLCHAHDQRGNQSLDKPALPDVQPFTTGGYAIVLEMIATASAVAPSRQDSSLLRRTTAPPIAVRHCCFRI